MAKTMRFALVLVLGVGLGVLAGCGDDDDGTEVPVPSFDGTWVVCRNDGEGDYRERFSISGTAVVVGVLAYETTDGTCDGDAWLAGTDEAAATFGSMVAASLGARTVQARQVDIDFGTELFYTLAYRDEAASPDALHLGDDTGALDGSTPALRPTALQALARALQTAPVPADLTGTWSFCPTSEGEILTLDAGTGAFALRKYSGTCGVGTVTEEVIGTFTLADPVYASLDGVTVTAFALDLAITGGPTYFATLHVDREASPRRLYHGNDGVHGMDGTSAALRPRLLSTDAYLKQ